VNVEEFMGLSMLHANYSELAHIYESFMKKGILFRCKLLPLFKPMIKMMKP